MKTCSCSQTGARRCLCPSIHRDRSHRHEELSRAKLGLRITQPPYPVRSRGNKWCVVDQSCIEV